MNDAQREIDGVERSIVLAFQLMAPRGNGDSNIKDAGRRLFAEHIEGHGGDALPPRDETYLASFSKISEALICALEVQERLRSESPEQNGAGRFALHSVPTAEEEERDAGIEIALRILDLAEAGQILMSRAPFDLARQENIVAQDGTHLDWLAHGAYLFKGLDEPLDVFEVRVPGASALVRPVGSETVQRATALPDEPTLGWRPAKGLTVPGREAWALQKKIGQGGFGEVWVAKEEGTRELRAFKFCFKAERLRTLKREQTLFRLMQESLGDRDDIARLYDVKLDEAPYYLELEYTPGGDLVDWVERQGGFENIPMEQRLELVAQVAEALGAANSIGILHKDIKPRNILIKVNEDGSIQPKLTDFGIGQLVDHSALKELGIKGSGFTTHDSTMQTKLGSRTGTRIYMAPELLAGKAPSIQSDVYALGVVLYQLVAGDLSRPLGQGWEREVEDELLREDIAACVDGDPGRRLNSAGELAARLEDLEHRRAQRSIVAEAEAAAIRNKRRRRLYAASSVTAAIIALVAGGVAFQQSRLRNEAEFERARAVEEEQTAKAVEGFLTDLFQMAEPSTASSPEEFKALLETRGRSMNIGEVLDIARGRIESDSFEEQPKLKARLLDVLADVYGRSFASFLGVVLAEEALDIRREYYGKPHEAVAKSLLLVGELHLIAISYDSARAYFEEALQMTLDLGTGEEETAAASLVGIAKIDFLSGEWDDAVDGLRQSMEIERRIHRGEHVHVANTLYHLSAALRRRGDAQEAEALEQNAIAQYRRLGDGRDPELAVLLSNAAERERGRGNLEQSTAYYREALQIRDAIFSDQHPSIVENHHQLAHALVREREFAEAEVSFRSRLYGVGRMVGDDHDELATAMEELATRLEIKGAHVEAISLRRQALRIRRNLHGNEDLTVVNAQYWLANALQLNGELDEPEDVLRDAIRVLSDLPGEWVENMGRLLVMLGKVLVQKDDLDGAEAVYREAIELGNYSASLALAKLHMHRADWESAEEVLLRQGGGDEVSFNNLGWFYMLRGDVARADEYYRKAIEKRGYWNLYGVENLSRMLKESGDLDAAEALMAKALAFIESYINAAGRAIRRDAHANVPKVLNLFGELRRSNGDLEGAAEAFKRAADFQPGREGAEARESLAILLANTEYGDTALEPLRASLTSEALLLGEGHPELANRYAAYAKFLLKRGQYDDLTDVFQQWMTLPPDKRGYELLKFIAQAASTNQLKGDRAAAEELWLLYLQAIRERYGDEYPGLGQAQQRLATMLAAMGRTEEAGRIVEQETGFAPTNIAIVSAEQDGDQLEGPKFTGHWSGRYSYSAPSEMHLDIWKDGNEYLVVKSNSSTVQKHRIPEEPRTLFTADYYSAQAKVTNRYALQNDLSVESPWTRNRDSSGIARLLPLDPAPSTQSLSGQFSGNAGTPEFERLAISMDLEVENEIIAGTVTFPLGELRIVKGRLLPSNRVYLEVEGAGVRGILMGSAIENGLGFLYEIGFGPGEAHLTKSSEPDAIAAATTTPRDLDDALVRAVAIASRPSGGGQEADAGLDSSQDEIAESRLQWSDVEPLNSTAETSRLEDDTLPVVATDGSGVWIAAWVSEENLRGEIGLDTDILYSRSLDGGDTWSAPKAISPDASTDGANDGGPQLVTDGKGVWVAVFGRREEEPWPPRSSIVLVRSSDNGASWSKVDSFDGSIKGGGGSIATDRNGNWILVSWTRRTAPLSEGFYLRYFVSGDNGSTWSGPRLLGSELGNDEIGGATLTTDGEGAWLLVWERRENDVARNTDVLYAMSTDNGTTWSEPAQFKPEEAADNEMDQFVVAAYGGGTWVVAWNRRQGFDGVVQSVRSTDRGRSWTAVADMAGGRGFFARSIATDGHGLWVVVRNSRIDRKGDLGDDDDLFYSESVDDGFSWTAPQVLNSNAYADKAGENSAKITTDGFGNWVTVWESNDDLDGSVGTDRDIFFATAHRNASAFSNQPTGGKIEEGDSHVFEVALANPVPPVIVQWKKDGVELPGATEDRYVIPDATTTDSGAYVAVVTDGSNRSYLSQRVELEVVNKRPAHLGYWGLGLALLSWFGWYAFTRRSRRPTPTLNNG